MAKKSPRRKKAAEPLIEEDPRTPLPLIPDLVRKAVTVGLSGLFTTEETIRRAVGDALPKDWVDFAVDQSERTRSEFIDRMVSEMVRHLKTVNPGEELEKLLTGRTLDVQARIRLLPDDDAPEPPTRRPSRRRSGTPRKRKASPPKKKPTARKSATKKSSTAKKPSRRR